MARDVDFAGGKIEAAPDEVEHIDAQIVDDLEHQDDSANELLDMSEDEIIDGNYEPINSEDAHTDED